MVSVQFCKGFLLGFFQARVRNLKTVPFLLKLNDEDRCKMLWNNLILTRDMENLRVWLKYVFECDIIVTMILKFHSCWNIIVRKVCTFLSTFVIKIY